MAQFTIYKDSDTSAPVLNGQTGSLLALLDACLYSGYGTKPGAGWTKPLVNTASYGSIKQGTGSFCQLFINDGGNGTARGAEALISGWDNITDLTGGAKGLITGSNQFPTVAQGVTATSGSLIARKSANETATARQWVVAADSRSMYCFVLTGDNANNYLAFSFGDIFSMKTGSLDQYSCLIAGRTVQSSSTLANDGLDKLSALTTATAGNFMSRNFAGTGGSVTVSKHGDATKGSATILAGTVHFLNGVDGGMYISPVWVCDDVNDDIRGRMRGFYQVCHAITNFSYGLTEYTGSGDYNGKTFLMLKAGGSLGLYFIETSNTLETN